MHSRNRTLRALLLVAGVGLLPFAAHAADYLANARQALQKGDLKTAQIELRNAVRSDPQNANARFLLAQVQLQLGDPAAAEQQAREAEARGYDKLQTTPLIAEALLRENRPADLLRQFQLSGSDPKLDAEIAFARGAAQLALGETDDASQSFANAERLNPTNVQPWVAGTRLALARGDIKGAQEQLDHALAADGKSVEARVLKAQLMAMNHDVPGALALLDAVVSDSPPAIPARLMRANLLIATGKFKEAQADDDAVLSVLPNDIEGHYLKAVLQHEAGNDKDADATLMGLASVFDRMPRGYYLEAIVKEKLGQFDLADDAARKYLAHVPNDLNGGKLLARIQFERNRPDLAIDALSRFAANGTADPQAYVILARAYAASGQPEAAVGALSKAEAKAPDDVGIRTFMSSLRLQLNQPDQAVQELEHAFALAPKQPDVAEALFLASLRTGDNDKAAAALTKIQAAQGDTPLVENLDGLLKIARLDLPGARAEFESILQKNPDFVIAKVNLARVLAMQGDNAGAEKVLTAILDKNAAAEPALTMLTDMMIGANQIDDALAVVERAHSATPKDVRLTQSLGDLYIRAGKAQKALDLVASMSPNGTADPQLLGLQAAAQFALKQNDQARATLTRIVADQPRNLVARRQLLALLVDAGDYEGARNVIKAGMAALPNTYQLYLDYALIDLKTGGISAALNTADALYSQNQTFTPALLLKGDLYMANKQPEEAVKAYESVAASQPSATVAVRIAGAWEQEKKPAEAEKVLKDWFAKHPDDLAVASLLSSVQINAGEYPDAKATLQTIVAKQPRDAAALNNLAWVDQKLGTADAKAIAQQAYAMGPSPQTADTLGWILTTGGDPSTGAILLRQASTGNTDPRIQYHFAVALNDTGQKGEAVKLLRQVVASPAQFSEKSDAQRLLNEISKGS
jgi:putative PEP-CTERM system TPR-repeat lipoprotein